MATRSSHARDEVGRALLDDFPDAPGIEADPAQGLEGDGEQSIRAFTDAAYAAQQFVVGVLVIAEPALVGLLLERDADDVGGAFITQVGQAGRSVRMAARAVMMPWRRAQVMSCSRPGRTSETHSGQPSGAEMTCTLPPWCLCFPDHHRSAPLGPGVATRSVAMRMPSRLMCVRPVRAAVSKTVSRSGVCAARRSMPHGGSGRRSCGRCRDRSPVA